MDTSCIHTHIYTPIHIQNAEIYNEPTPTTVAQGGLWTPPPAKQPHRSLLKKPSSESLFDKVSNKFKSMFSGGTQKETADPSTDVPTVRTSTRTMEDARNATLSPKKSSSSAQSSNGTVRGVLTDQVNASVGKRGGDSRGGSVRADAGNNGGKALGRQSGDGHVGGARGVEDGKLEVRRLGDQGNNGAKDHRDGGYLQADTFMNLLSTMRTYVICIFECVCVCVYVCS
jgi:hypothetical protein